MPETKTTTPTPEKIREYIAANGTFCPFCGSDNISAGELDSEATAAWQDVDCKDCGATWTDEFTLSGISTDDGHSIEPAPEPITAANTHPTILRVIGEVAGTISTDGIQQLDRTERGGTSTFLYVRNCLVATAYNAVRSLPGFAWSYGEFFRAVDAEVAALLK